MEKYIHITEQEVKDLMEGLPVMLKIGKRIVRSLTMQSSVDMKKNAEIARHRAIMNELDKLAKLKEEK